MVRVHPGVLWSWCSGSTSGCGPEGADSTSADHPGLIAQRERAPLARERLRVRLPLGPPTRGRLGRISRLLSAGARGRPAPETPTTHGLVAQLGERPLGRREVAGATPAGSTEEASLNGRAAVPKTAGLRVVGVQVPPLPQMMPASPPGGGAPLSRETRRVRSSSLARSRKCGFDSRRAPRGASSKGRTSALEQRWAVVPHVGPLNRWASGPGGSIPLCSASRSWSNGRTWRCQR